MGMADWGTVTKVMSTKALFISRPEGSSRQIPLLHYGWKAGKSWLRRWKSRSGTCSSPDVRKEQEMGCTKWTQKSMSEGAGRNRSS